MDLPVTIITTHSGVGVGEDGPTHQVLDACLLANFHNIRTFEPCNAIEAGALLAMRFGRPDTVDYFRLTRQKLPVFEPPYEITAELLDTGAASFELDGEADAYIVASGATVTEALSAQKTLLEKHKLKVPVVNIFSVDAPNLGAWMRGYIAPDRNIFTFQDAYPNCMRSVCANALSGFEDYNFTGKITSYGPTYGKSGKQPELYKHFNIDAESIVEIIAGK